MVINIGNIFLVYEYIGCRMKNRLIESGGDYYNYNRYFSFYNEEYLLPWWLAHHTKLFDHGILINKGSTDRSVEICKNSRHTGKYEIL